MSVTIDNPFPPVGEARLCVFEEDVSPVPRAFRAFLLEHNGGTPHPEGFGFTERDGSTTEMSVGCFFGIGTGRYDLRNRLETYAGRFPPDLFPIADTPMGDLVLLAHDDSPRAGKVFYWFHEEEADEGEEPDDRNVYPVADSFEAFLALLHE